MHPPIRISPSRLNYSDPMEIIKTHLEFLESLPEKIKKHVLIRPAPNHRTKEYIKHFDNNITRDGLAMNNFS